jgi:hypothetical protein
MSSNTAWVVTWLAIEAQTRSPGKAMMPNRKQKAFDDQKSAVSFAMSLVNRSSIQLHMPGGQIVNFPVIEQMARGPKLADDK